MPEKHSRMHNNPRPFPICGATNRSGFDCGHKAGQGTDHLGIGRCWLHGGRRQTLETILKSKGLVAAVTFPGIQEEYERLKGNEDVFNLRDHIHLIEAIAITVLKNAKTVDDLPMAAKLISDATKAIQKLDEIEHGRRLVVELPELRMFLAQIKEVIFRHVLDSHTRDLIGQDFRRLPYGGASVIDQPNLDRPALESSVAVEGGS